MRKIFNLNYDLFNAMANQPEKEETGCETVEVKHCKAQFDVVLDVMVSAIDDIVIDDTTTEDIVRDTNEYVIDKLPVGVYVLMINNTNMWLTVTHDNYTLIYDDNDFVDMYHDAADDYMIDHFDFAVVVDKKQIIIIAAEGVAHVTVATLPLFSATAQVKEFRRSENKDGGNVTIRPII